MKKKFVKVLLAGCMIYLGYFIMGPLVTFLFFMYYGSNDVKEVTAYLVSMVVFMSIYMVGAWEVSSFVTDYFIDDSY